MNTLTRSRQGLSLIEMIVVLNIIAMLIALSVPVYRSVQRRGRETSCRANLALVGTALRRYRNDKKKYPFHLADLYPQYVSSESALRCPADPRRRDQTISGADETSGLNLLYIRRDVSETGEQVVCGCPFHSHSLVQYLDGRVSVGEFQEATLRSPTGASIQRREKLIQEPVTEQTRLRAGDAVFTGANGSGVIAFDEGTTVTLGANTLMVIKIALTADQPTKLIRVLGMFVNDLTGPPATAVADVMHGLYDGGGGRFEIQTPTAVAAVRGTVYQITVGQVNAGGRTVSWTKVCPIEGEVEVKGNGKSKKLKPGPGDQCYAVTATRTKVKKHEGKGNGKGNGGDDDDDEDD